MNYYLNRENNYYKYFKYKRSGDDLGDIFYRSSNGAGLFGSTTVHIIGNLRNTIKKLIDFLGKEKKYIINDKKKYKTDQDFISLSESKMNNFIIYNNNFNQSHRNLFRQLGKKSNFTNKITNFESISSRDMNKFVINCLKRVLKNNRNINYTQATQMCNNFATNVPDGIQVANIKNVERGILIDMDVQKKVFEKTAFKKVNNSK